MACSYYCNNNIPLILFPGWPEESQRNFICLLVNPFLFLQDSFRLLGTRIALKKYCQNCSIINSLILQIMLSV